MYGWCYPASWSVKDLSHPIVYPHKIQKTENKREEKFKNLKIWHKYNYKTLSDHYYFKVSRLCPRILILNLLLHLLLQSSPFTIFFSSSSSTTARFSYSCAARSVGGFTLWPCAREVADAVWSVSAHLPIAWIFFYLGLLRLEFLTVCWSVRDFAFGCRENWVLGARSKAYEFYAWCLVKFSTDPKLSRNSCVWLSCSELVFLFDFRFKIYCFF